MTTSAAERIDSSTSWVADNFARLEKQLNGHAATSQIHQVRRQALSCFAELGFPSRRNEDWKYTDVSRISKTPFELALVEPLPMPNPEEIRRHLIAECHANLVFVNGHFVSAISQIPEPVTGLSLLSFAQVLSNSAGTSDGELVQEHLARHANSTTQAFVALNTAFVSDGAFLRLSPGVKIAKPIQFLFFNTSNQKQALIHPRLLFVAGKDSGCAIIESHVGLSKNVYFNNVVSEAVIGEGAKVEHFKIQLESETAFHVATLQIQQAAGSSFSTQHFSFGGALVRNEIYPVLNGENIECLLFGLTAINGQQHVDNHTVIDHAKPNCFSNEHFKGVYSGKSSGVFNGTIIVRQDAQKTNAIQTNNNLLLSDDATVDTRPQLKIWANDVKCTHGATIGKLDEDALFYLRARGINQSLAQKILTEAFAGEVLDKINSPELADYVRQLLTAKLN